MLSTGGASYAAFSPLASRYSGKQPRKRHNESTIRLLSFLASIVKQSRNKVILFLKQIFAKRQVQVQVQSTSTLKDVSHS